MSKFQYQKTIFVLGHKSNLFSIATAVPSCGMVVCNDEIETLINVLSTQPRFTDKINHFKEFYADTEFQKLDFMPPTFYLHLEDDKLSLFCEKLADCGFFTLSQKILTDWIPAGVNILLFSCSNTKCYY